MTGAKPPVIDASAVLALFEHEPGWQRVASRLGGAAISTVNWAEVVQKNLERGVSLEISRSWASSNGIEAVQFTIEDAETAASMARATSSAGLSLGDRACLALAQRMNRPALTADRRWANLKVGAAIEMIR